MNATWDKAEELTIDKAGRHQTSNYCPSEQTTQCMPSVQLLLARGTVCHSLFKERHLLPHSDDTWILTCSSATLPLSNCNHPCLWFEPFSSHDTLQMQHTCLLTYLTCGTMHPWTKSLRISTCILYTNSCLSLAHSRNKTTLIQSPLTTLKV